MGVGCTWLYTPWMPIKGSNTRARYHSFLCVLFIVTIRLCWRWIMMTAVIESDYVITCPRQLGLCDLTAWFFLVGYLSFVTFWQIIHCRQRPTRNACCGRETARCRCEIRYISKCSAASRGPPCDSAASFRVGPCKKSLAYLHETIVPECCLFTFEYFRCIICR